MSTEQQDVQPTDTATPVGGARAPGWRRTCARRSCGGQSSRATGSARRTSPQRLGASRLPVREALRMLEAEGLTEHEPNKGARVPRLSQHEVDVIYRMRERLEPLALAESLPLLTDDDHERLEDVQRRIEDEHRPRAVPRPRPRVPPAHLQRLPDRPAQLDGHRLWNSTQHYRRAFVSSRRPEPDVGRQRRAPADPRRRRAPRRDRRRALPGRATSGGPGSSSATTPRSSGGRRDRADRQRRSTRRGRRRPGHPAAVRAAQRARPGRLAVRLRAGPVRRLLRARSTAPWCRPATRRCGRSEGTSVVTVEGLGSGDSRTPCSRRSSTSRPRSAATASPAIIVRAAALLADEPDADADAVAEALDRNLCRCGAQQPDRARRSSRPRRSADE